MVWTYCEDNGLGCCKSVCMCVEVWEKVCVCGFCISYSFQTDSQRGKKSICGLLWHEVKRNTNESRGHRLLPISHSKPLTAPCRLNVTIALQKLRNYFPTKTIINKRRRQTASTKVSNCDFRHSLRWYKVYNHGQKIYEYFLCLFYKQQNFSKLS